MHAGAPGRREPVLADGGLVLELGCGSGLLTRHLLDAGHRVIATDASPAMLDLARTVAGDAEEIRRLVLPDDPLPEADAIVGVGHVLNYLPDELAIDRALLAIAGALRPDGILAIDLCDLEWAEARRDLDTLGRVGEDWAIVTELSIPSPDRFVRQVATFLRNEDGSWRRGRRASRQRADRHRSRPGAPVGPRGRGGGPGLFRIRDPAVGLRAVVGRRPR